MAVRAGTAGENEEAGMEEVMAETAEKENEADGTGMRQTWPACS